MRVALLCETFLPNVNGVTTTLRYMLEHLQQHGHPALLFAPTGCPAFYAGAQVVPLAGVPLPCYPEVRVTPPQPGIIANLRRFRPDVIHFVGPLALGTLAPFVWRALHVPVLTSYHTNIGAYSPYYGLGAFQRTVNAYLRWVHNRSALTLCPSSTTLRELQTLGYRRVHIWRRGVDSQRYHPGYRSEAWRRAVGARDGETVLLYVGRVAKEKRVDLLADTLADLDGIRLVVVGDGPARPWLQRRMAGLPVHFSGYLHDTQLAVAYASADVFVFPSDTDTFGQVIQEAMASGLPVIGARSGATPDLVEDGVTGVLFSPGAGDELRSRLDRVHRDREARVAMGRAARAAAQCRSWPVVLDELMAYYHLAARPLSGRPSCATLTRQPKVVRRR